MICLSLVTIFLAFEFRGIANPGALTAWTAGMAFCLSTWLAALIIFTVRKPADAEITGFWIPAGKAVTTLCNLIVAASVWIFMPPSGPDLRALMIILYAWYLVIQFVAASEATQVLAIAVVGIMGSLVAWLIHAAPPYYAPLAFFFAVFGVTLIAVRRFIRAAVVEAAAARAAIARERDAKTHFIRAASHDLQQPLQAAALFLDRIKPSGGKADHARNLGALRQSLTAARSLVAAMLEHLKLEGGVIRPTMQPVSAGTIFDRVLLTQAPAAAAAGIALRMAGGRTELLADPALLTRAMENLVANAIRHSGATRILIGARRRDERAWLWVIDDGCGIADADAERIFSPFEQAGLVGLAGGFGLGLAATRNLLTLMDGDAGIARGAKRGAAFYLRLATSDDREIELRCAA
jgi:signal transduction histidine kinase